MNHMTDELSPEQAARLLYAKAAELENYTLGVGHANLGTPAGLTADIALVAQLLAEHIERTELGTDVEEFTLDEGDEELGTEALEQSFREGFNEGR